MFCFWISNRQGLPVTQKGGNKTYPQLFCKLCYNTKRESQEVLQGEGAGRTFQEQPSIEAYITFAGSAAFFAAW